MKKDVKTALITGGAGFIGSHLIDALLADDGWRVWCVDNLDPFYAPSIKRANLAPHRGDERLRFWEADLAESDFWEALPTDETPDLIVHLAAKAGVRPSIANPLEYERVNVRGTLQVLEFARKRGIQKLVFASSSSVYGVNNAVPWSESDRQLQPISPYAATKLAGEALCSTYSHLYAIQCVVLRFFTVYGERQRPDLAIHKFMRAIAGGQAIDFFGDGSTRRDYTYVGDIVQGILGAMQYAGSPYEIINLGGNQPIALRDLVETIESVLGKTALRRMLPDQPGDVPATFANIEKARQLLGYQPKTSLQQGLERFARWMQTQG